MQVDTLRVTGAEDRALLGSNLSADTGAKTRLGPVTAGSSEIPHRSSILGLARGVKSQGSGDGVPRVHLLDPSLRRSPLVRRTHVSAFDFCKSLFRCWVSQSFFSLDGLEPLRAYPCVDERLGRELCGSR